MVIMVNTNGNAMSMRTVEAIEIIEEAGNERRNEDTDIQHTSLQSGEDRLHPAERRGHYGLARMCVSGSSQPTRWL